MMAKPHVVILGAGPAGVGAAFQLTRRALAQVSVLEQNSRVGGNAGSFELAGMRVDYGSHRLHPTCHPDVLRDIRALLGDELLDRPRHGRIRLRGRWIHFPLKPLDLISFPPGVVRRFRNVTKGPRNKDSILMVVIAGNTPSSEFTVESMRQIEEAGVMPRRHRA